MTRRRSTPCAPAEPSEPVRFFDQPQTLPAELRDYPEWHRGRPRYGIWMIPVRQPALLSYITELQSQLADLLHPPGARQAHLTLFVCGFAQPAERFDDDFTPQRLQAQIKQLRRSAGPACTLPLGAPDSFASAAFLPVGDPEGRLARWRAILGSASEEIRQADYVPHITLGLYRRQIDAQTLRQRLAELPATELTLEVDELHYASYESGAQFGALHSEYRVALEQPLS